MKFLQILAVAAFLAPTVGHAQSRQPSQQDLVALVESLTPQQKQRLRDLLSQQPNVGGRVLPTNFAFPIGSMLLSILALSGNNNNTPATVPGAPVSTTP